MNDDCVMSLVSVIIPTYNRSATLTEAMDSVFEQTYRPVELLVIDDGSKDDTLSIVETWKEEHGDDRQFILRYFSQENSGAPAARNLGLIESRGEYIQFLDSDDLLHPEKLSIQISCLTAETTLDYVYSGTGKFVDQADWKITPYAGHAVSGEMLADFLRGRLWNTLSGVYRRRACVSIGPWTEDIPIFQDWEYNIGFILFEPEVKHIDEVLSLARFSGDIRITDTSKSYESLAAILSLYKNWELYIRRAGKLTQVVQRELFRKYYKTTTHALGRGYMDLARDAINHGSRLETVPELSKKFKSLKVLTALPGKVGCQIFKIMTL
jgi:glycosyltransferase involved in cell wall biosynthesis